MDLSRDYQASLLTANLERQAVLAAERARMVAERARERSPRRARPGTAPSPAPCATSVVDGSMAG